MVVSEQADLDVALPAILFGAVGTCGQRCTTIRRVIAQARIYDTLCARLQAAYQHIARHKIGNPLAAETLPGLALDLAQDEELAEAFRAFVVQPKRERIGEVLDLARMRGELFGDVDVKLLCDMLVGPLLYRSFLTGDPTDEVAAGQLVDTVLRSMPVRAA